MKKTLILCTAILAANLCFSQDNLFGRVGINTSNPRATLHVEGGVGATPDSVHALFMNKNFIPGSPQLILYSLTAESGGTYGIQAVRAGLQGNGNLVINELGGNVGIGNPSPDAKLDVTEIALNKPTFLATGYVTDNPGVPAIGTIRGIADGGAIFEVSKASGAARNWGLIRIGVDGNLSNIYGSNGNIGINIMPKRSLHVDDVMRLEPRNSAPSSPSKGDIYFDNVLNKLRVYDGTVWQSCW